MVLALGIWTGVAGYTVLVWGLRMVQRHPESFAYLVGLSTDPGAYAASPGQDAGSPAPTPSPVAASQNSGRVPGMR